MKKLALLAALPLALTACSSGPDGAVKTVTVSATPSSAVSSSDIASSATSAWTNAAADTIASTETDDPAETQAVTSEVTETATPSDYPTSDTVKTPSAEAADTATSDYPTEETASDSPADTPATIDETATAGGGQVDSAMSSARSYLDYSAFSKQGLIDQLSSQYGEKYPLAVATQAVNSLTDVDWNAQAVKSAQSYLKTQAFSCAGLTDQLSSQYGEKFTAAQAAYGASQTSACK